MRIKITQKPRNASMDGVQLDRFELGREYQVGTTVGSVLLSEGWAEPVVEAQPVVTIPVAESAPAASVSDPPNLTREFHPVDSGDPLELAADVAPRFRGRPKP
jgi:hypothetical protein